MTVVARPDRRPDVHSCDRAPGCKKVPRPVKPIL